MSSNAPKRGPSEEGGHVPSPSVRPNHRGEEESVAYPAVNYVPPQSNRMLPPLRSAHRMTLPSLALSNSRSPHASQPVAGVEVRTELRDSKEVRESKIVESNRDYKFEPRDMHYQSGKVEKEGRVENKVEDGKVVKYGMDWNDSKNEVKVEKDVSAGAVTGVHPSLKDLHSAKRHPDIVGGGGISGTWSNSPLSVKYEASKESSIGNMNLAKERVAGNEAVGENIVDSIADDKYKDRKGKEGNHHDWSESDKVRSDSRSKLQPGSSSDNDFKEGEREERDSDRLEKEKKDNITEKERLEKVIEKEKDNVDKEGKNGIEKDGQLTDKDVADKPSVKENISVEFKKPSDSWRNMEREAKERRKEREGDVEGERPEKRRCLEKESDEEGVADVGEGTDKERDSFSYGVRLKKRMLRARGSPQVGGRDARVRSRGQEAEGSQGKPEVSTFYKVGECLQELTKLWTEHKSSQADNDIDNLYNGPTLEIRIPAEHVTATNRQVRGGQLWGTDIYTDDSDLVAVLMHTGYCRPTASPPPAAIQELCATIRVLPPQESYVSTLRNNVRSRAWGAAIGCSYRVERCCIMKRGGGSIDLEPCLTHTSTIEPTLAPVAVERTMTTRAAASNALRQQRFVREVTIQYNLCNEPWIKYSISIVADKGLKKPLYTSARLKKGEVLYLETHSCRYELCFASEKMVKDSSGSQSHEPETGNSQNHVASVNADRNMADGDNMVVDMFRWSKCKRPLPQKVMRSIGIPLPLDHVEVLEENVDWEDVQWSQTGVWIAEKEYQLARVHFLSPN